MDTNYTFPRPQGPTPRPAPTHRPRGTPQPTTRESNALRASVLDAALELGIGNNSLVTDWMFNNSLKEEDEEEDQISSPGLTYGSSATSEESSSSAVTPSSSTHSSASSSSRQQPLIHAGVHFASGHESIPNVLFPRKDVDAKVRTSEADNGNGAVGFPGIPIPPRPTTPSGFGMRKLKKKPRADEYESDGGYLSEAGGSKKKREKEKKKLKDAEADAQAAEEKEKGKEAKARAKEEKKELEMQERTRKKSLISAVKASKKADKKEKETGGYDTDGGAISTVKQSKTKKSKSKPGSGDGAGYETDAGYQSSSGVKKSKTRFFKLPGMSSRTDLHAEVEAVPAMPEREMAKEIVPLPIAGRFATTLSPTTASPSEGSMGSIPAMPRSRSAPTWGLNTSASLPPLSFQSFTQSTAEQQQPFSSLRSAAPSPSPMAVNRDSQASTMSLSSSESHARRHAGQFSPTFDSSSSSGHGHGYGHGLGGGSNSTITSSSHQSQNHSQSQTQDAPPMTNGMLSPTHSAKSGFSGSGSGSLKPPIISFPITRSPSPMSLGGRAISPVPPGSPPVAPLQISKSGTVRIKPRLEKLNFFLPGSRNASASPSPMSPALGSPYVVVGTPSPVHSAFGGGHLPPSPRPVHTQNHSHPPYSHSYPRLPPSPAPPNRPRNLPTDGYFGPLAPPPSTPVPITAQHHQQQQQQLRPPHLRIVPSSEYFVPSPRQSPLTSPNVLAYYDIPAPSPPPMGPLPNVPSPNFSPGSTSASQFPSPAALRQRIVDRTPRHVPDHLLQAQGNIQRGKESPFPARPVLPSGSVAGANPTVGLGPGLDARAAVRRYRDLYTLPGAVGPAGAGAAEGSQHQEEKERVDEIRRVRLDLAEREMGLEDVSGDAHHDDEPELRDVLDRFEDRSAEGGSEEIAAHSHSGRALERRLSSEILKEAARPRERESEYVPDDLVTVGDRTSRWSGSVYSRASILDEDESGEARDRFVKRVEAMLNSEEKKKGAGGGLGAGNIGGVGTGSGYVPPVPRLPDAYVNMGIHPDAIPGWNKF